MLEWFKISSLKASPEKYKFMVLGTGKSNSYKLYINDVKVSSSEEVKLLRVTIDNQLKFKKHI